MRALTILPLLVSAFLAGSAAAQSRDSQIKQLFTKVNNTAKGALGKNAYQRPGGRTQVLQDSTVTGAPRDTLFVAAFRNDVADQLASLGFYVGNHFSSNYWELHNEFLATPQEQRSLMFRLDHARFMNTPAILPKAQAMNRHMLLESFYMQKFPNTRLTRGMQQRGTADAVYEINFYAMTIQYLAAHLAKDTDYVALFETQRRFNLTGDTAEISLQRLRDAVASIHEGFEANYPGTSLTADFYVIRNAIHNYMTPDVLTKLNAFLSRHGGEFWGDESSRVRRLRDDVAAYYRTSKKTLQTGAQKIASKLDEKTLSVIGGLSDRGNSSEKLEQLSWVIAQALEKFRASRDPEIVHWIIKASRFVQTDIANRGRVGGDWPIRARIALDTSYAAGLVSGADWSRVRTLLSQVNVADAESVRRAYGELVGVISAAPGRVREGLSPAFEDWAKIDRTMEGIVDDTLRASMLTELDQVVAFVKKSLPKAADTKYVIENDGETYGYLTYVPKGTTSAAISRLETNSIPVFAELPLDLGVVAGIVTEQPQTPLSHVNIKSKARGTPNVYYPDAAKDPLLKDLIAKKALVKLTLKNGLLTIREAPLDEARRFWASKQPAQKVEVRADLKERRIRSTKELGTKDVLTVGAKAANYAEAARAVGDRIMLEAFTIPFVYYKEFTETNEFSPGVTIAARVKQLLADPRMKSDREFRVESLKALQKRMTSPDMKLDAKLIAELQDWANKTHPGRNMRFRSSTNSEDLPNFSGAGLYDSYSYDPKKPKKSIPEVLKKTWASVWNLRAFDEREHFGIDHLQVYMAVLVSPAFPTELANGVAVTRNVTQPRLGTGFYINTQLGEEAVTNPNPQLVPEELIVLLKPGQGLPYTLNYMKYSTLSPGKAILGKGEVVQLTNALKKIHDRFKKVFDPKGRNPKFAVDVEWKIDDVGGMRTLFIKQARPYVD